MDKCTIKKKRGKFKIEIKHKLSKNNVILQTI